jgi:hypothetical protein
MKKTKLARLLLWAAKQDMSKKKGKVEKNTKSEKFRRSVSQFSVMVPNYNWRAFFILSHVAPQSKLLLLLHTPYSTTVYCSSLDSESFFLQKFHHFITTWFHNVILMSGHTHLHFKCTVSISWIWMNQYRFPSISSHLQYSIMYCIFFQHFS